MIPLRYPPGRRQRSIRAVDRHPRHLVREVSLIEDSLAKFQNSAHGLMRIVVGFLFFTHGGQKLFGWFGADGTVELLSRMGVAGILEFVGGLMIMLGLFTRPVAFILSGQMAVAYFWVHLPNGLWPWANRGELAALYSWVFLFLATAGGGSFSVDSKLMGGKDT
jgi:putative oxidoreductase